MNVEHYAAVLRHVRSGQKEEVMPNLDKAEPYLVISIGLGSWGPWRRW